MLPVVLAGLMSKVGTLNYDKWSNIIDSDDEADSGKVEPLLDSQKVDAQRDADAAVTDRFITYLRKHLKKDYALAQRKLVARFVGVQHRGTQASNIYRYNDICGFAARVRPSVKPCPRQ
jgi:hypothetical protein